MKIGILLALYFFQLNASAELMTCESRNSNSLLLTSSLAIPDYKIPEHYFKEGPQSLEKLSDFHLFKKDTLLNDIFFIQTENNTAKLYRSELNVGYRTHQAEKIAELSKDLFSSAKNQLLPSNFYSPIRSFSTGIVYKNSQSEWIFLPRSNWNEKILLGLPTQAINVKILPNNLVNYSISESGKVSTFLENISSKKTIRISPANSNSIILEVFSLGNQILWIESQFENLSKTSRISLYRSDMNLKFQQLIYNFSTSSQLDQLNVNLNNNEIKIMNITEKMGLIESPSQKFYGLISGTLQHHAIQIDPHDMSKAAQVSNTVISYPDNLIQRLNAIKVNMQFGLGSLNYLPNEEKLHFNTQYAGGTISYSFKNSQWGFHGNYDIYKCVKLNRSY